MPKSMFSARHRKFLGLLIEARKRANLTQSSLAVRLRRQQSFVSKFERGERRLDVLEFLEVARALEVDPVEFLKAFDDRITFPGKKR